MRGKKECGNKKISENGATVKGKMAVLYHEFFGLQFAG
jgi:hypothetical protein